MVATGIDGIPNELLRKIFTIAADQPSHDDEPSQRVLLTHIAKSWRQTALDMPHLWNNIRITNRSKTSEIGEFLTRSKDIELRITIDFLPSPVSVRIPLAPHMRLALAHAKRWHTLSMIGDIKAIGYIVQSIISSGAALDSLLMLEIHEERGELDGVASIYGPFTFNPAVFSTLLLRNARIFCSSQGCLAGVTSLDLGYSFAMLDQTIANAVTIPAGQPQGQGVVTPPVLPVLSSLRITAGPDPFEFPTQLAFDVSCLTTLTLVGFVGSTPAAGDEFNRLAVALAPPTLTHLGLDQVLNFAWDGFIESISTTTPRYPNVQTLTFRSLDLQYMDINVLLAFPALRSVHLFDIDATTLLELLRSVAGTSIWANTVILVDDSPVLSPHLRGVRDSSIMFTNV